MSSVFCHLSKTVHYAGYLRKAYFLRSKISRLYMYSTSVPQPDLRTMKFDTAQYRTLLTPEVKSIAKHFQEYGYEFRIAGGAVRDLLMNLQPTDIDFATTATPDEMKKMFTSESIRMFNRKGESHGTVSIRVEQQSFEITTLRVDMHTDGRHAEVEFTTNWELDASRRDLTINAMFLGLDGVLYDYFRGIDDLEKRIVKFVGNAESRIKEDYLRILRYFRFYGRIAVKPDTHDASILEAVKNNIGGLEKISGERLWTEVKKILIGNHVKHVILRMLDLGIAPFIGLPSDVDVTEFQSVCERSAMLKPQAVTLLAALLRNDDDVQTLHARLKLSKYERDLLLFIVEHRGDETSSQDPLKPYKTLILESKVKLTDMQDWVCELLIYKGELSLLENFKKWTVPKFPVNGTMLLQKGFKSGPKMNLVLTELKSMWIKSDCALTPEELLLKVDSITLQKQQSLSK